MKRLISFMLACTVIDSLQSICPGAHWTLYGDKYDGLVWLDDAKTMPSKAQVDQGIANCQAQALMVSSQINQAVSDAKNVLLTPQQRIDALIKVLKAGGNYGF